MVQKYTYGFCIATFSLALSLCGADIEPKMWRSALKSMTDEELSLFNTLDRAIDLLRGSHLNPVKADLKKIFDENQKAGRGLIHITEDPSTRQARTKHLGLQKLHFTTAIGRLEMLQYCIAMKASERDDEESA